MRKRLVLTVLAIVGTVGLPAGAKDEGKQAGRVVVYRTIMPDSQPSSFAVSFPSGVYLCYDPVRGSINYIWAGDFIDLSPTWTGKNIQPGRILGEPFYRETRPQPLRRGTHGKIGELRFKGYEIRNGYLEFRYLLDGISVREEIRSLEKGIGLIRSFHVPPNTGPFWFLMDEQPRAIVSSADGKINSKMIHFPAQRGRFTIVIQQQKESK